MRINRIKFFNINSLKGEHEIPFDDEPLADSGLYAITGPTGSGKSTILDVITLALYNQVPRLGKITRNNIEKMGSIITHYTDEAWAEIEYSTNTGAYRSRWSISTARTGNLRDYEMDIIKLPEEKSLGFKKSDIPGENEKIIGLSYDQFMKSMLLSQGDFSKFLIAKKEDRAKLLEEITGTEIYRKLGAFTYEKTKDKKQEVEKIESQMQVISLLSKEELEEINQAIKVLTTQVEEKQKKQNLVQHLIQLKTTSNNLAEKKIIIQDKKTLLEKLENDFESHRELISVHEEAKAYENEILNLKQGQKNLIKLNAEASEIENQKVNLANQKALSIQKMSSFINQEVNEDDFYEKMAAFEKEINEYDSKLSEITNQGKELRSRINKLINENQSPVNESLKDRIDPEQALEIINKRIQSLSINPQENAEELRNKWETLLSKISILKEYEKAFKEEEKHRNRLTQINQDIDKYNKELSNFESQLKSFSTKEKELRNKLDQLKKEQKVALKEAKFEDFRSELIDGEPCPLCGAEHHPYAHKELTDLALLTIKIDTCEKEVTKIDFEQKQLDKNIAGSEARLSQAKRNKTDVEKSQTESQIFLDQMRKNNNWISNIADSKWQDEIENYNQSIISIKTKISEIEEQKFLNVIHEEFANLSLSTASYKNIYKNRQEKYKGADVNKEADALQNNFTEIRNSIKNNEKRKTELALEIKEIQQSIADSKSALKPLKDKYELDSEEACSSLLLEHKTYLSILEEKEKIASAKTEISTLQKEWDSQNNKLKSEIDQLDNNTKSKFQKEKSTLTSDLLILQRDIEAVNQELGKKQATIQNNDQNLTQYKLLQSKLKDQLKDNEKWILLNDLIGDSQGKKFANYAQDLTLVHLLIRANARLEDLTDRYMLSFKPDDDDLQIIDKYQGDTVRAVKTLSGGETFLISLALALSLSDLASKNVRLESLFIDEGFGTLDQETLEVAMSTLEKLQTQGGKKIGIISHVESLKERINTKIQVHKNAQGYSRLEIVG